MEPRAEMIGATPLARISAEAVSQLGPSSNKKGAPVFPAPLAEILPDYLQHLFMISVNRQVGSLWVVFA